MTAYAISAFGKCVDCGEERGGVSLLKGDGSSEIVCLSCVREREIKRLHTVCEMLAEERDSWRARVTGEFAPICQHSDKHEQFKRAVLGVEH